MTTRKKQPAEQSFEEALHRLEEIVEQLERGDVPLEDSMKLYEEGVALSKACAEKLSRAELSLKRLSKDMDVTFKLLDEEPES